MLCKASGCKLKCANFFSLSAPCGKLLRTASSVFLATWLSRRSTTYGNSGALFAHFLMAIWRILCTLHLLQNSWCINSLVRKTFIVSNYSRYILHVQIPRSYRMLCHLNGSSFYRESVSGQNCCPSTELSRHARANF